MRRRDFIALLGGSAAAWPLAASAQQRRYLIGHLAIAVPTDTPPPPPANWNAFVQGLREAGYTEGRNIEFEHRSAHDQPELFPKLASELADLKVDVIFAAWHLGFGSRQKRDAHDPNRRDRPRNRSCGGGIGSEHREAGKQHHWNVSGPFGVERKAPANPQGSHTWNVSRHRSGGSQHQCSAISRAGAGSSLPRTSDSSCGIEERHEPRRCFRRGKNWGADALIVLSNPLSLAHRVRIGELAAKAGLPTIYLYRAHVSAGGLISYGPDLPDMFRRCGGYVGRILGGTKPADLPIERPARFELVVNLKTAKALGITIPETILYAPTR